MAVISIYGCVSPWLYIALYTPFTPLKLDRTICLLYTQYILYEIAEIPGIASEQSVYRPFPSCPRFTLSHCKPHPAMDALAWAAAVPPPAAAATEGALNVCIKVRRNFKLSASLEHGTSGQIYIYTDSQHTNSGCSYCTGNIREIVTIQTGDTGTQNIGTYLGTAMFPEYIYIYIYTYIYIYIYIYNSHTFTTVTRFCRQNPGSVDRTWVLSTESGFCRQNLGSVDRIWSFFNKIRVLST